ncbi:protogenin A-like isoform X1 [Cloeon dipterum]|uniref:protogenin A-like isoform X1 n=1 Tax=Cloeon dipterum TaxID=197152 RepID=UPI00322052CE
MASRTLLHCLLCTIATLGFARANENDIGLSFAREPPKFVIGYKGKPLVLACAPGGSHSEGSVSVSWLVNGEPVVLSDRVSVQPTGSLSFKEIKHDLPQHSDEGNYQCKLTSSDGLSLLSKASSVRVAADENDIGLSFAREPPKLVIGYKGKPLALACAPGGSHSEGSVSVSWLVNGEPVVLSDRVSIHPTGYLSFREIEHDPPRHSDEGNYQCKLTSSDGLSLLSKASSVRVAVFAASFTQSPKNLSVEIGDTARLSCHIEAVPTPNIFWRRDNKTLPNHERRYSVLRSGVLLIDEVQESDAGVYHCIASNKKVRIASEGAYLEVVPASQRFRPARMLSEPETVDIKVQANETLSLECEASGYPVPLLRWSSLSGSKKKSFERQSRLGSNVLAIPNSMERDSDVYTCEATNVDSENKEHHALIRYNVSVQVPPIIKRTSKSVNRIVGTPIIFKCDMAGVPTPKISWYKNGTLVDTNERVVQDGWHLIIRNSLIGDAGIYQCRGWNDAGEAWAAFRLVEEPGVKDVAIDPPTDLKCGYVTTSSIDFSWNASAINILAYSLYYYETARLFSINEVTVTAKSHIVEELKPLTNYSFFLIGFTIGGASNISEIVTCRTAGGRSSILPQVTLVQANSPTSVTVFWKKPKSQETLNKVIGQKVLYRVAGSHEFKEKDTPTDVNNATITGLTSGVLYKVCVISGTKHGWPLGDGGTFNCQSVMMPEVINTTQATLEIKIVQVLKSAIKFRWARSKKNRIEPRSYNISAWRNGTVIFGPHNVGPLVTNYSIKDIDLREPLTIQVRALNVDGDSVEVGSFEFKPSLVHAESVSALEVVAMSSNSVKLTWEGRYGGLFRVSYKLLGSDDFIQINSSEHSIFITDLKPYSTYKFSVQSYYSNLNIGASNQTVQCQTLEAVPEPPSELNFTQSDSSSGKFTWSAPSESNGQIRTYLVYYTPAESADQPLEQWLQAPTNQTWLQVSGLLPTSYVATVNASTSAGYGRAADFFKFQMLSVDSSLADEPTSLNSLRHDRLLLAVSISAVFIFFILVVGITYRLAKALRLRNHNIPHTNGNGLHHHSEGIDMMVLSSSSNIPPAQTDHLDTKGWHPTPQATGVHSNGRIPNGTSTPMLKHVHITENPRFLPRGDGKSACPSCPGPGCNSRGCPSCQVEPLLAADVTQVTVLAED